MEKANLFHFSGEGNYCREFLEPGVRLGGLPQRALAVVVASLGGGSLAGFVADVTTRRGKLTDLKIS